MKHTRLQIRFAQVCIWQLLLLMLLSAQLHCSSAFINLPDPVAITLEHAVSDSQQLWGLMQRRSLPDRHGMLFPIENHGTFLFGPLTA